MQLWGLGELCKLPQRGLGGAPAEIGFDAFFCLKIWHLVAPITLIPIFIFFCPVIGGPGPPGPPMATPLDPPAFWSLYAACVWVKHVYQSSVCIAVVSSLKPVVNRSSSPSASVHMASTASHSASSVSNSLPIASDRPAAGGREELIGTIATVPAPPPVRFARPSDNTQTPSFTTRKLYT